LAPAARPSVCADCGAAARHISDAINDVATLRFEIHDRVIAKVPR
jgi:hypothetical protein